MGGASPVRSRDFSGRERDGMYINLYAAEGRTYFILEEL